MNSPAQKLPQVLNGFDLEQLAQAVATVGSDAKNAQIRFRAKTSWQDLMRSRTEIESYELAGQRITRRHVIHSDEPLEIMGTNQAPNPQDLLLAALNACMVVGFVVGATQLGIRIEQLEIESECGLDLRGAFGIDPNIAPGTDKITYTVKVKGDGTAEQFEQVHKMMMAVSPNRFHIATPIPLESKLVVL